MFPLYDENELDVKCQQMKLWSLMANKASPTGSLF